jgi:hypothetical protein
VAAQTHAREKPLSRTVVYFFLMSFPSLNGVLLKRSDNHLKIVLLLSREAKALRFSPRVSF